MKTTLYCFLALLFCYTGYSQTKVSGLIKDASGEAVPFANVVFENSIEGTISNEDGRFYLESDKTYDVIIVSFVGYTTRKITLEKRVNYKMEIILEEGEQLNAVVIVTGKQSKKNNPAIDILRKIWERKRFNGVRQFKQYAYDKYEKVEFDLNTIDSAMMKSRLFRGMEFIFQELDTSRITGKTYLPIFINEAVSKVYGDNEMNKEKEDLIGNKNSGFSSNETITAFIKDLYAEYDIYDNYLKFFDKSFTSPLSKTGINTYNYVLSDTAYIDNKLCFNIIYYPRRKNELTFKGDFWVNDSTFAIKKINLQASKSANINWVKEIYIEQEFDVVNDSVFLLKRDYMLSDFALNKKEKSKGVYGKRTTLYDNYVFDEKKPNDFYSQEINPFNEEIYERDEAFWDANRMESLNKDEKGVYKMLDTLKTVPKFKRLYSLASILASGYVEFDQYNLDYGPIFSTFGFNDVEGIRLRAGGRTYFGPNDKWRIEGYGAYGFRDDKFKYGISGKWLLNPKNRLIISGGNRRDVEQTGVSLTTNDDVLGRSFASSALFASGNSDRLTDINLTTVAVQMEPWKNVTMSFGSSYKTTKSASPETFSLSYIDTNSPTGIADELRQSEVNFAIDITPGKRTIRHGVERKIVNDDFPRIFLKYSKGVEGVLNSDFNYSKVQLFYRQPFQLGGFGRTYTTLEVGKTYGDVPLSLLSVVPGNQAYFSIYNTFSQLNYYEFVTDTYASLHIEHNFNGRIFSRIPFLRKLNLREIVGIRGVWGEISNENVAMNTPAFQSLPFSSITPDGIAPNKEIYWEYSVGVGNIFKVFRIDFNFRGNYKNNIDARQFGVTGAFGFHF
ncbi:TonB-dependent receptor SusC [Kordia antarctica]|uniref:TonB-dependent receptor SusC n=1 Tax=Kordia antarctica TaxID=1218801 RepID=A0A7L4ZPD9_9FLAO|nr:DUF5686 and carboxypeptidase-like regulatory domain-containing protein [Kordia antarctica]QHI38309.1 TonB-dependent receptor SusC [Kordia antarctica]